MASNDALLLHTLLESNPARDGPDPYGFTQPPKPPPLVAARRLQGLTGAMRPAPRRVEFLAANDLDEAYYTVRLRSVTGIDPLTSSSSAFAGGSSFAVTVGSVGSLLVSFQILHLGEALTPAVESSLSFAAVRDSTVDSAVADSSDEGCSSASLFLSATPSPSHEEAFGDELVVLPVPVAAVPLDSEVRCRVYSTVRGLVARCAFHPFSLDGELQTGHRRLALTHTTTTTTERGEYQKEEEEEELVEGVGSPPRTPEWELHMRALHRGTLTAVPWLDGLTTRHLDTLYRAGGEEEEEEVLPAAFLHVELPVPSRTAPVLHLTDQMDAVTAGHVPATTAATLRPAAYHPSVTLPYVEHHRALKESNVCEGAAAIVAKSLFLLYDAGAPPGLRDRARLLELAERPPLQLEPLRLEEASLLWQYRHFITRDTRLFIPFMRGVDWRAMRPSGQHQPSAECRAACELIPRWKPLGLAEALGCLGRVFRGVGPVRQYAVRLLDRESDGRLCRMGLQLIQALRYDTADDREVAQFLLHRAVGNWELCSTLYWGAAVEAEVAATAAAPAVNRAKSENPTATTATLSPLEGFRRELAATLDQSRPLYLRRLRRQQSLRGCLQSLHTTLNTGPGDRTSRIAFGQRLLANGACGFGELFAAQGRAGSSSGGGGGASERNVPVVAVGGGSTGLSPEADGGSGKRHSRAKRGQAHADPTATTVVPGAGVSSSATLSSSSTLPVGTPAAAAAPLLMDAAGAVTLPTHPAVVARGVEASSFFMFKSAKQPMQVGFLSSLNGSAPLPNMKTPTAGESPIGSAPPLSSSALQSLPPPPKRILTPLMDNSASSTESAEVPETPAEVRLIYKVSDDVRQDQLILQLVHWTDALLRLDGLNLYLTPYRVLATGPMDGLVEVVPGVVTFQSVQRDALRYLRVHNPTSEALRSAMDRYTRSFAGYSVFTYVLGVGDRHLENILLAKDGRLLHIDFGYILGHDPKPFPPPMKISREMLEVLGGPESPGYTEFKTYCCLAYNTLRKHAALLLNLLQLMCDAEGLPQLTGNEGSNADGGRWNNATNSTNTASTNAAGGNDAATDPRIHLLKVQEKLRLDLSNAQATQYIQNVIADSVGSLFTGLWDVIHAAAQATRA